MVLQSWSEVFTSSLQNLWGGFIAFVPGLIVAILFIVVGWILGAMVGRALNEGITALKIDRIFESAGITDFFKKIGFRFTIGRLIGGLVKWFVILAFLIPSLNVLGLSEVNDFLKIVVLQYLPKVFVAALVLIVATFVADAAARVVGGSAKATNARSANTLAAIVKYAIWVFAFFIALPQLGIAEYQLNVLFTGIVAMLAIAGGIAFGMGGKDHAQRLIDHVKSQTRHEQ